MNAKMTVFTLVGPKDSGKTTLACSLIRAFLGRGLKVGSLKSIKGGQFSREFFADSFRHFDAGSVKAVALREGVMQILEREEATEVEDVIASTFFGFDVVVCEGFSESSIPKVLVLAHMREEQWTMKLQNVVCTVNARLEGIPFFSVEDVEKLAEFLLARCSKEVVLPTAELFVNGIRVNINPFVRSVLANLLVGFCKSLRGVDVISEIRVKAKVS